MSDKNPVFGPQEGTSPIATAQQISAVERAGDLKVEAIKRELDLEVASVRHELSELSARFDTTIADKWKNHDALHNAAHESDKASLLASQRSSDAIIDVQRREWEEKLECLRRDSTFDTKRLDALIAAEVNTINGVINERGNLYSTQFKASEVAVNAALAAAEKAVNAAFLASEKAIVKAEGAQKDYNDRSNDFRSQIDDQAKSMMPRIEVAGMFKSVDDRFTFMQQAYDASLGAVRVSHEKIFDAIIKDVSGLRESRSEGSGGKAEIEALKLQITSLVTSRAEVAGAKSGVKDVWGYVVGAAGIAFAVARYVGG